MLRTIPREILTVLKEQLTKDTKPVIDGNYNNITECCQDGSIIEVATSPRETVSMNEEDNSKWRRLDLTLEVRFSL